MAPLLSLCPSPSSLVFCLFICKYLYNAISWMLEWNQGEKIKLYTHLEQRIFKVLRKQRHNKHEQQIFSRGRWIFFISEKEVNFWKKTERLKKKVFSHYVETFCLSIEGFISYIKQLHRATEFCMRRNYE